MTETCETRLLATNQACGHLARACMMMTAADTYPGDPYRPVTVTMLAPV
jgi:hypothetical protein